MTFSLGLFTGWLVTRAIATATRGAKEGTIAHRIHIAVVGPWRPK